MNTILAWHFVGTTLRDGRPVPPDGKTLRHRGPLELCASGLHASVRLIDALQYAPDATLCRVRCGGEMLHERDKLVCRQRTILWRIDAADLLRAFARQCALDAAHLWEMPELVRRYLESGDESLRAAAGAAAWAAASDAALDMQNDRLTALVAAAAAECGYAMEPQA